MGRLTSLPPTWDLGSSAWLEQGLGRLRVETVHREGAEQEKLYVIKQSTRSRDPSFWYVATTSSTAVLFVFRKQLLTMHEIATAFLDRSVPYGRGTNGRGCTISALPPSSTRVRPMGFKPSNSDYLAYLQSREDVFRSPRARVLRLRGVIIGRLALEVVPNITVLDGPSFCDDVIGRTVCGTDNTVFVDDFITENDLDIVSGVCRVSTSQDGTSSSDLPWWPKHKTWMRTGLFTDQSLMLNPSTFVKLSQCKNRIGYSRMPPRGRKPSSTTGFRWNLCTGAVRHSRRISYINFFNVLFFLAFMKPAYCVDFRSQRVHCPLAPSFVFLLLYTHLQCFLYWVFIFCTKEIRGVYYATSRDIMRHLQKQESPSKGKDKKKTQMEYRLHVNPLLFSSRP
jgi:hypothetical protein